MKKGIVMGKHRRYMIVMQNDGVFCKAPPMDVSVGSEISFEPLPAKNRFDFYMKNRKISMKPVALLCVVLLLLVPVYFTMGVNKTYAYVSIDINPSIELEINEEMQVRSMTAVNEDGKKIVKELPEYKGKQLEKILALIMQKSEDSGLTENGKSMLLGVSYALDKHELSVLDAVDSYFIENGEDWQVATFMVPKEIHKIADEKKLSMGEVMVSKMNDSDYTSNQSSWMNEEEKAIINSFYNNDSHSTTTTVDNDDSKSVTKQSDKNSSDNESESAQNKPAKETNNINWNENGNSRNPENNAGESSKANEQHQENRGKARGHHKDNPGKAKGHSHEKRGKVNGHHKGKAGKAQVHFKENRGKAKGHSENIPGKAKGHHKGNPGKAKGHHKDHPGKAKGHHKNHPGKGHKQKHNH
ncbi:anti-sigma-I factor RsgI [Virgibacillus siamensis]|uniref:Anti-sigma-I factor RsgI n=1 Tax=Virgibacillus siamensis TaxID=480071 RepID=A0ABN1FQP2_9BACI